MKKVAISIGHYPDSAGKTVGKYSEYSEMAPVAGLVVQTLMYHGVLAYMIGSGRLEDKITQVHRISPDAAVELHLNAGGGDGCEVLYTPNDAVSKNFAAAVQRSIVEVMKERDRGVKPGYYKMDPMNGPDYFLAHAGCPAVIAEAYFLDYLPDRRDNAGKLEYYSKLALSVSSGVIKFLGE